MDSPRLRGLEGLVAFEGDDILEVEEGGCSWMFVSFDISDSGVFAAISDFRGESLIARGVGLVVACWGE